MVESSEAKRCARPMPAGDAMAQKRRHRGEPRHGQVHLEQATPRASWIQREPRESFEPAFRGNMT